MVTGGLKVCRKITKITHSIQVFFSWQWDESEDEIFVRTFEIIDLNRFLMIEIACY